MSDCCFYLRVQITRVDPVSTLSCAQYVTQGYKVCTDLRNIGVNKCNQWANQSYQACSGWNKWFSWLCIAWTWLVRTVCVGWYMFYSLVCFAYMWLAHLVCVAWHWVTYYVVTGFLWFVYLVCTVLLAPCFWGSWLLCRSRKDTPRNELEKSGWILTFSDDFTSGSLDPAKWQTSVWTGSPYLHDWASGTTPSVYFDPLGFSFGTNTVRLISSDQVMYGQTDPSWVDPQTTQKLPFDIPYRGAWMMWPNPGALDQQYGYFEIRCKTPEPPEAYPAFWLYGRHKEPDEIDIFEFNVAGMPDVFTTTVHWGPDKLHHHMKGKSHQVCRPWQLFHIYACEWSPKEIRFYCDNQLIRVVIREKILSYFTYPLALIVNTGPDTRPGHHPETGTYPNFFEVDYVRVYRRP